MEVLPRIRTSRQTAPRKPETGFQHDGNPIGRLIAKIVREERPVDGFEDYQALKAAVRKRLTILRVRYRQAQLDDAISLVDRNTPLVRESDAVTRRPAKPVQPAGELISPARSKRLLDELEQRTGLRLRSMPRSTPGLTTDAINQFKRDNVWHR